MRYVACVLLLFLSVPGPAQSTAKPRSACASGLFGKCLRDVAKDQAGIWTSPLRTRPNDFLWIAPLAAGTAVAIHYDPQALQHIGVSADKLNAYRRTSDITAIYVPIAAAGAAYVVGVAHGNTHLRETGALSGEAMLDAYLLSEGLKYAINRERPDQGDHTGRFWPHGFRDYPAGTSLPSGHTMLAWSFAHVVSDEYPHWWVRLLAYSTATTASVSRIVGRKHFPGDVVVGSALGYLVGGYVFHHHRAQE